ncbi:MAG: hypothetical protein ABI193_16525, partial [Minicystis sp.]
MSQAKSAPRIPVEALKSARLEAALEQAIAHDRTDDLFDLLARASGLPGPRANLDLARAMGLSIAAHRGRADALLRRMIATDQEFVRLIAAVALGARSIAGLDTKTALAGLQELAGDARHSVRSGVVLALRLRITALGEAAVDELAAWTDGYLQAHVALEALAERSILDPLPAAAPVLTRLNEAFALADLSKRADERLQGVRTLRAGLPKQIVTFAARFPDVIGWVESAAAMKRPETREVVAETIRLLRKANLSDAEAKRLDALMTASAKP